MAKQSWFDEKTQTPLIDQQARQLDTFLKTMEDGIVDEAEIKAQEGRLVALMKEVEPQLSGELHHKVTQLLCELSAYDIMRMMHEIQAARPRTKFRG